MSRQPRQRKSSARMNFFEQHVFNGSHNATPIEVASVPVNLPYNSEALDLSCQHEPFEQHVFGNQSEHKVLTEDPTVHENIKNSSLINTSYRSARQRYFQEHVFGQVSAMKIERKRKSGNGEGTSVKTTIGVEKEVNNDDITGLAEDSSDTEDLTSTRRMRRKKKFEKDEGTSVDIRITVENEVNNDDITGGVESSSVDCPSNDLNSTGQALYQRKRGGVLIDYNDNGDDGYVCAHCDANFWLGEANKRKSRMAPIVYTGCCQNGRVKLEQSKPTPMLLEQYLNPDNDSESLRFRKNIRLYNSMFGCKY